METRRLTEDLLSESEATLRMMDALLEELGGTEAPRNDVMEPTVYLRALQETVADPERIALLSNAFFRVHVAIIGTLEALRRSRGVLERTTTERVQRTQLKLREVTSTTESAATDMLDGLDRALQLIDRLDSLAQGDADGAGRKGDGGESGQTEDEGARIRAELRQELFTLITCLQFQDITAQQLSWASAVLADVEERLEKITRLFNAGFSNGDESAEGDAGGGKDDESLIASADPSASMLDAGSRQALVDEIFGGGGGTAG